MQGTARIACVYLRSVLFLLLNSERKAKKKSSCGLPMQGASETLQTATPYQTTFELCRLTDGKGRWDWKWFSTAEYVPIVSENSRALTPQHFR